MVVGDNEIGDDKNEGNSLAILTHGDAAPDRARSGECLCRIVPAAVMVNEFVIKTQNTNKTQLLPSNHGTFRALVVCENFIPQIGPSTQLIDTTSFIEMRNAKIGAGELSYIFSYQTL